MLSFAYDDDYFYEPFKELNKRCVQGTVCEVDGHIQKCINDALWHACEGQNYPVIKFLLKTYKLTNLRKVFEKYAYRQIREKISRLVLEKIDNHLELEFCLYYACAGPSLEVVKLVIAKAFEVSCSLDWQIGFNGACIGRNLKSAIFICEKNMETQKYKQLTYFVDNRDKLKFKDIIYLVHKYNIDVCAMETYNCGHTFEDAWNDYMDLIEDVLCDIFPEELAGKCIEYVDYD
jgi:hypothetical protein